MNYKPLISIIMPAYNASRYVAQAMQSILDQSYDNFELLVADDGSTDKTRGVIDRFNDPRIIKNHNKRNRGKVYTTNKLLRQAKGAFITFQDADDFSNTRRLETLLNAFQNKPELGMLGSNVVYCKPKGKAIRRSDYPLEYEDILKGLPDHFYFTGAAVMLRSEIVAKYGGYHEYFRNGGEDPYWVGSIALTTKFENVPQALYYYRLTPNSLSRSIKSAWQVISLDIVKELLKQRIESGTDDLESGNQKNMEKLEAHFTAKYRSSENWLVQRSIYRDIQNKFLLRAYKTSWQNFFMSKKKGFATKELYGNHLAILKALLHRKRRNQL